MQVFFLTAAATYDRLSFCVCGGYSAACCTVRVSKYIFCEAMAMSPTGGQEYIADPSHMHTEKKLSSASLLQTITL